MMKQAIWTRTPERGSFWVMRLGLAIMKLMGYRLALVAGLVATCYFFVTGGNSRRASREYLRRMNLRLPGQVDATLWSCFKHHWHFAVSLIDRMWFWQGRLDDFYFDREGRHHLIDKSQGALLIGAHIGSFDALRAFALDKQVKLNAVMYRAHAAKFNRLLRRLNAQTDVRVVEMDGADVGQIFDLKQRLDRGEFIAMLGDRPPPQGRKRVCAVPLLGDLAELPQSPWILASLLECPVYFPLGVRVGLRRYHISVQPIADRVVLPRKTREASLQGYMARYAALLEKTCLQHPYQWFNFYDFWQRSTPEAGQAAPDDEAA